MLTRAAKRRNTLRHLQHAADQIQLPWLCPVMVQSQQNLQPQRRPITSRPSIPRSKPTATQLPHLRQLASAAPVPEIFERNDDYTNSSFYRQHGLPLSQRRGPDISALRQFDLSKILQIDYTTALPPAQLNTNQVIGNDIRGNAAEVESNLEACLDLKKWPRAFASLGQLEMLYFDDKIKLRIQYNKVLAYMVDDLIFARNPSNEERIMQWIEREMKRVDLDPDAHTFALVIRAALHSLTGAKRERTVRRYWDMAKRYDLRGEVGSLRSILSERDLGMISEICPLEPEAEMWKDLNKPVADYLDPEFELFDNVFAQKPDIQIKEMEQKGLGLASLRQSLSLFGDPRKDLAAEPQLNLVDRQRRLERDAIDSALSRWKAEHDKMKKMGILGNTSQGKLGAMLWQWHSMLTTKITEEIKQVRETENKVRKLAPDRLRMEYGPFLEQLAPEMTAATTVIVLMQIMSKNGASRPVKLVRVVTELGKAIEAEHQAERKRRVDQEHKKFRQQLLAQGSSPSALDSSKFNVPHPLRNSASPNAQPYLGHSEWTTGIHAKVGSILCELMFDTARISITKKDPTSGRELTIAQPIFVRKTVYQNGKKAGVVTLHEDFVATMLTEPSAAAVAKQLPMVCKPRKWKNFSDGGYLESDLPVLRVKNSECLQKDYAKTAAGRGDLDQMFAGLDVLGHTGWKINPKVFAVMAEAWNSGEAVANIPPLNKRFDVPERPAADATSKDKFEWFNKMRTIENEKTGIHSNRCFQNLQMEIAKAYQGETFYLPHNVDFRGRAYPIPPYLNQMGADNCRGLMLFADGRELGESGLRWLKIHLSNVFGYDKASLADRTQFPMDHLDDIRDSIENPLTGRKWWLTAEDPWQCLATCFELVQALDAPEPTKFVSHLPVHQDGSCNGLQHYAALGGDMAGAKQVNLEPGDKPADVYTGVAELVKSEISRDAAEGSEVAKLLDGRITRKIVKQTVMTNVYGVTFLGAIRQVRKQVEDLIPEIDAQNKSGLAATYIARKIFNALGSLFTGAHDIQYWLGDCANRITGSLSPAQLDKLLHKDADMDAEPVAKPGRRTPNKRAKKKGSLEAAAFRTSVIWTTPLKLPVVQPYRVNKGQTIQTNLQRISIVEPSVADSVDKRKQLQAFPPNFIHSLDATHMILSALKANELGLTFSAVHDSFWTHAADVNTLNALLRDAFIRMHSEDIVGRLAAEFRTRYSGHIYFALIQRRSKLGEAIIEYRKQLVAEGKLGKTKGSQGLKERKVEELLREVERMELLKSSDPKARAKGKAMVTASSLFEQYDGEKYIHSKNSLGETAIGQIPDHANDASILEALASDVSKDVDMHDTLEPLIDSVGNEDDVVGQHDEDGQATSSEMQNQTYTQDAETPAVKKAKKPKSYSNAIGSHIWLWLPLTFKPVPKKGDFDVTRLRDSQYFFS